MRLRQDERVGLAAPGRRLAGAAALAGELLWTAFGPLGLLAPLGVDVAYDEGRGYDVVLDRGLFVLHRPPGALAARA